MLPSAERNGIAERAGIAGFQGARSAMGAVLLGLREGEMPPPQPGDPGLRSATVDETVGCFVSARPTNPAARATLRRNLWSYPASFFGPVGPWKISSLVTF